MADETTTEMLAETEAQVEYTPPEGWRVVRFGEPLRGGDEYHSGIDRYIRRIEPKSKPEPEPEKVVTPDDVAAEALAGVWDQVQAERTIADLEHRLGAREQTIGEQSVTITQLQKQRDSLQNLVTDLRTINDAQEKAVRSAGRENTDLQHRLDVVSKEWAEQAATISRWQQQVEAVKAELVQERLTRNHWQNHAQRAENELANKDYDCRQLRIELDALQQSPQAETVAAMPTSTEDRFEEGWDAGTARAVETIAEWLEPIRQMIDAADNVAETERASYLAADIIRALPAIMRSLTGLTPED